VDDGGEIPAEVRLRQPLVQAEVPVPDDGEAEPERAEAFERGDGTGDDVEPDRVDVFLDGERRSELAVEDGDAVLPQPLERRRVDAPADVLAVVAPLDAKRVRDRRGVVVGQELAQPRQRVDDVEDRAVRVERDGVEVGRVQAGIS
jgi:hypothetical protein